MKITRRQLRRLILKEVRIKPDVTGIPPQHLDKIHSLIDAGDLEQAQAFIDAFDGDPNYINNHREYESVGDLEKLGNEREVVYDRFMAKLRGEREGDSSGGRPELYGIDAEIRRLAGEKASSHTGVDKPLSDFFPMRSDGYVYPSSDAEMDAYDRKKKSFDAHRRRTKRADDFIIEHRIKPAFPTHIPAAHVEKINTMLDSGRPEFIDQAKSFLDAYGAPNYVDDYAAYQEAGDIEKLGAEAEEILSNAPQDPEGRRDALRKIYDYGIESQAEELAQEKAVRDSGKAGELRRKDGRGMIDLYDMHMDRYFKSHPSGDTVVVESRIRNSIRKMILKEMAVRRILEIDMSDQYYLRAPELPGGEVAVGVEVEDLIDALYAFINKSYTHIVMSDDLRDFNRDRSQFRYGIYTKIETAIKMLQIHRDPRRLYIQRS